MTHPVGLNDQQMKIVLRASGKTSLVGLLLAVLDELIEADRIDNVDVAGAACHVVRARAAA